MVWSEADGVRAFASNEYDRILGPRCGIPPTVLFFCPVPPRATQTDEKGSSLAGVIVNRAICSSAGSWAGGEGPAEGDLTPAPR